MAKVTLTDVANITGAESAAIAAINANWDLIMAALENTLSRDGTSPNQMNADFDLNSYDVLNGGSAAFSSITLGGVAITPTGVSSADTILTALKTVDGTGSGLDADLFDGQEGSYYLDMDNMSEGASNKILTAAERAKLSSRISVTDYSPAGDGITDDTTEIQAAVTAAYTAGEWLYWPDGTYLTSSNISNLHDVKHFGPGAIKRGSNVFYIGDNSGHTANLYCSPLGSATNDGLSSSQACTFQGICDNMVNYGPVLPGTWNVYSAAGTYTEGIVWPVGLRSQNRVNIFGATATRAEPTTIIDGTSAVKTVGFYATEQSNIRLVDFKVIGFSSVGYYGFLSTDFSSMYLDNCWADGNYHNVGSRIHTKLNVRYGQYINGVYSNILLVDFVLCTIGYTSSTVYSGSGAFLSTDGSYIAGGLVYGIYASENCQGHVDYCLVDNNATGIFMAYGTRLNTPGCTISNNIIGVSGNGGSFLLDTGSTYTSNTDDYAWKGFSGRVESNLYADVLNVGHTAFLGRDTTSTAAPATLGSYQKHIDTFATLPGGALKDGTGRLRIRAVGAINKGAAASGRLVAFRIYAGGNFIAAGSINTNNGASGNIVIDTEIFATSSSGQKYVMNISAGSTRLTYYEETFYGTSSVDLSADQPLHIYTWRDSSSDTVTFEIVSAELYGVMD